MRSSAFLIAVLVLLFGFHISQAGAYEVRKKAGEFTITVKIKNNPPCACHNRVIIDITDSHGHPIRDAKVTLEYSRPAIHEIPTLKYRADTQQERGRYIGIITLSMAGPWNVEVRITRGDKTLTTHFTVDVE